MPALPDRSRSISAFRLPTLALRFRNCNVGRSLDCLASLPSELGLAGEAEVDARRDLGGEVAGGPVGLDRSTHDACDAVRLAEGSVERVSDSRRSGELGERCGETEDSLASGGFAIGVDVLAKADSASASASVPMCPGVELGDARVEESAAERDMQGAVRRAGKRARRIRASVSALHQSEHALFPISWSRFSAEGERVKLTRCVIIRPRLEERISTQFPLRPKAAVCFSDRGDIFARRT